MKFSRKAGAAGVTIPKAAIALSKLDGGENLELHALESAAVLLKGRMTAMELLSAVKSMDELSGQLLETLAEACEQCVGCEEDCPFLWGSRDIKLPSHLLEAANIPEGARLCAEAFPESGCIVVSGPDSEHSLDDVPDELLDALLECGVCLESLNELIGSGEIIYGE